MKGLDLKSYHVGNACASVMSYHERFRVEKLLCRERMCVAEV
jgi:hypothetical protein